MVNRRVRYAFRPRLRLTGRFGEECREKYEEDCTQRTTTLIGEIIGWGGRIRTFTGLINSEVPYQLDHAPAASAAEIGSTSQGKLRRKKRRRRVGNKITRARESGGEEKA